jgi:hypothetical protein
LQNHDHKNAWAAREAFYSAHQLGVLAAVGNQLTSCEVLQLLQQTAEQGFSDAMRYIAGLAPAQEMDDVAFCRICRFPACGNAA